MKNRYDKVMRKVEVTPEMRERILNNVNHLNLNKISNKSSSYLNYRKYLSIAACFMVLLVGSFIINNLINNEPAQQIVPNIIEYSTLKELSKAVDFDVREIQELPFEVENVLYVAYWEELAEIEYKGQSNSVLLRMAKGSDDISGNTTEYTNIKAITSNGYDITLKGEDDKYMLAVWQADGYTYSLQFTIAVSEQEILDSIQSLN